MISRKAGQLFDQISPLRKSDQGTLRALCLCGELSIRLTVRTVLPLDIWGLLSIDARRLPLV